MIQWFVIRVIRLQNCDSSFVIRCDSSLWWVSWLLLRRPAGVPDLEAHLVEDLGADRADSARHVQNMGCTSGRRRGAVKPQTRDIDVTILEPI